ncbi:MAG: hypothetical protein RI575_01390 [Balneolaceae bacterium]|nr:hypothetical protein [Balneolaceae bacterium]MDR9407951.1 hypothetical protein [Balneolaceae bacterium]
MKRITPAVFLLFTLFTNSFGQSETLLNGDIDHGGYGGLISNFSEINNSFGVTIGGYGAWLIDHTVAIGGGGLGLTNDIKFDETPEGDRYISFGYGGLYFGYLHNSQDMLHLTVETFIGSGEVNLRYNSDNEDLFDDDRVFVIDPTINVELNLTNFMRVTIGVGYRFVNGVNLEILDDKDLSSPTFRSTIRFGSF